MAICAGPRPSACADCKNAPTLAATLDDACPPMCFVGEVMLARACLGVGAALIFSRMLSSVPLQLVALRTDANAGK
eukprot:6404403-Pyramimonas_sp.AAC.1